PVLQVKTAIADPQRWNRYAHGRNNPLRYVDPTGAVLELTGKDRAADFKVLQRVAGPGAKNIAMVERGQRTFVEFGSPENGQSLARSSEIGATMAGLIESERTIEFQITRERFVPAKGLFGTRLFGYRDLGLVGGAGTLSADESLNGNTQIFINPGSVD